MENENISESKAPQNQGQTIINHTVSQQKTKLLTLLIFLNLFFVFFTNAQEGKEVIKIDVDNECKSCISKRTFVDEIFSQQLTIASGVLIKAKIHFAYHDNFMFENKGKMIYFNFDQDLFQLYDTKNIYLKIDNIEYNLNLLVDFVKNTSTNARLETVYTYSLGYVLTDSLANAIKNAKLVKFELIRSATNQRKSWDLSESTVKELVMYYNCFVKYYTPIDQKLKEKQRIIDEEYEKNLKSFETDFRNSKWSDSKEMVKSSESTKPAFEQDDALIYDVTLNNDKFEVFLYFNNDRLYQGVYLLREKYVNENNFYSKYKEIKTILTSRYGEPKKVIKHRSRDLYNGANEIGMAIKTGEYTEYTLWETKTSTILLIIEGENFKSDLTIRYNTKDLILSSEVKKVNKEERESGF